MVSVWNVTANLKLYEKVASELFITEQVRIDLKFTVMELVKNTVGLVSFKYNDP
jgi:hypothetical protein